jgi:hypothetical protein
MYFFDSHLLWDGFEEKIFRFSPNKAIPIEDMDQLFNEFVVRIIVIYFRRNRKQSII